jgi:N-methylhydantoinase A
LTAKLNEPNIITIDMGGTSSDICLIEAGRPRLTTEADIEGYPIKLPMIDINTIGAGGGSIAWIDAGGALRVGPQSAGADPGPVCYDQGGNEPTVTDANAILGRINPGYLLGGDMAVNLDKARQVVEDKIARPLGLDLMTAAAGIIRVVNANMIRGIRRVSVERGYDPRDFALVPFGGAGPLHGVDLAQALNMTRVIVPTYPGIASAYGMLSADVRHDYVQTFIAVSDSIKADRVEAVYQNLEAQGTAQLAREGFTGPKVELTRLADLRYVGQSYELSVPVPSGRIDERVVGNLIAEFHHSHQRAYGYTRPGEAVEFVNLRLVALGQLPVSDISGRWPIGGAPPAPIDRRAVNFEGQILETPIYQREGLVGDISLSGPAVVEQLDSTIVIPPGYSGRIEAWGNMIIQQEAQS